MNIQKITSRNNDYIKEIVKLKDKKHRDRERKFCFEGIKLLEEAVKHKIELESVLLTEKAYASLPFPLPDTGVIIVSDEVYEKISFEKSPEGVFCVAKALDKFHNIYIIYKREYFSDGTFFILDGIQDPGNLGTVLRTASAFGCGTVILSEDCADIYNSKTIRASMGAVFRQRTVRVSDTVGTVKELQAAGKRVLSAALHKDSFKLSDITPDSSVCFIIGNEGNGIRQSVISASDGTVFIPMNENTESLNAAVAATVLLWEQYKAQI
ncbi:MAG: RNA methyltransferase [Ruminococcaceae bacterium]|nr:RNA methyltransferase [Oscillospiraceae bacterium]MBQ9692723.1 RNA methyltransferase [Clostridia bacterium]